VINVKKFKKRGKYILEKVDIMKNSKEEELDESKYRTSPFPELIIRTQRYFRKYSFDIILLFLLF
jgi:hypothetical protein